METTNRSKHIDLTYLKQLSNGSNDFINQMISVFMAQTPEALDSMDKYLDKKDWKSLHGVAHKIKASFSFMGIKELENDINLIEEYALSQTNLNLLPDIISHLKNVCNEAMKELEIEKKSFL
ncbi:MAG: Hpt domain-containing protein [Bacteroidia bacterium]